MSAAGHIARLGRSESFDRGLLPPMMLGAILNPINSSIIAVSLVPIGVAFGAPPSQTAWLVSALYLATAVGQPVVGRLIDLFGPRRMFLMATALVGAAGVVGVLAPSLPVLVAARVLLGFGTCAGYPAAMHVIRSEAERTGRASPAGVLTILSITTQTIAVIGPPLGGLLVGLGGWRTTLGVNIPLAAAALVLGARLPRGHLGRGDAPPGRLDVGGVLLFAGTLVALLLFLMDIEPRHWYFVALAAAGAAAFAWRERRAGDPFIDLGVLAGNVPLLLTYGRALLAYVVSYSVLYGYTQWLEDGRGLSATQAGLVQLPVFATGIVVAAATGPRPGLRGKLLVGAIGQIAGCALMLLVGASTPIALLLLVAIVFGIPQGLNSLALQNSVYHQAEPERIAASAGLLRTFGYLGAIVAAAAQGAFFAHAADTDGLHELAMLLIVIGALFLLVTLADRSLRKD
jgi:MFS family permease